MNFKQTLLATALVFSFQVSAEKVFHCESNSGQTLKVYEDTDGVYTGILSAHTLSLGRDPEDGEMACTKSGRGHRYRCTENSYIVEVFRSPSGRRRVEVSLDGSFEGDSGYLFSFRCQ